MSLDFSKESAEALHNRPGHYLLYSFDKQGFEQIKPQLSGDDWFPHDPAKYNVIHNKLFGTSIDGELVLIWMHFSHDRDSGASQILWKMSPDKTGEMKFLSACNSGVSINLDEQGNWTSLWKKESTELSNEIQGNQPVSPELREETINKIIADTEKSLDISKESMEISHYRPGQYLLYSFDKQGFEQIKPQLSGDDWFPHDPAKYNVIHDKWLDKSVHGEKVLVWMHFSHDRDSGASQVLWKMSPDKTGEMKFLSACNSGVSINLDEQGNWTSLWKKESTELSNEIQDNQPASSELREEAIKKILADLEKRGIEYYVIEGMQNQMRRNGRWGTCVNCPDDQGRLYGEGRSNNVLPENCPYTDRYDHWLGIDALDEK